MNCPVARALEVIGDKWTILILRDLFLDGPKKYQDLLESLKGISPNILANRLKKLMAHQILRKDLYQKNPPRFEYSLTKQGESLREILMTLKDWGQKHTSL